MPRHLARTIKPVRLQLSRKKGFNLQAHSRAVNGLSAINCARPTRDGNPYIVGRDGIKDAEEAVRLHREMIEGKCAQDPQAATVMWNRLRGKNLACWCRPNHPCHVDTLLDLACAHDRN
jgi:Domain of unknown function (DUF4326)